MTAPSKAQLLSCFIGSNIVALGAGTPYMFSFYAPELIERCNIPISQSSTLSFALTIGSAALGFLAGMIIDKKSPQLSCGIGALCTFLAYWILKSCYARQISNIWFVSLAMILVGFGSVSGFYSAVKCCTTNFPRHRGTAGAFPVSLYALSGLVFSSLCASLFQDRMEAVFTFLMYACSAMILTGCFTLRILVAHTKVKKRTYSSTPTDESSSSNGVRSDSNSSLNHLSQPINIQHQSANSGSRGSFSNYKSLMKRSSSRISTSAESWLSLGSSYKRSDSFVWAKELPGSLSFWGWGKDRPADSGLARSSTKDQSLQQDVEGRVPFNPIVDAPQTPRAPARSDRRDSLLKTSPSSSPIIQEESLTHVGDIEHERKTSFRDNHIYRTVVQPKFIAYYLILATLQGIGQTYIYSVGFIIEALVHSNPDVKINTKAIQSLQVSIISIMSFTGRICAGPASDLLVKRMRAQREWCIVIACALMYYGSKQLLADIVSVKILEGQQNVAFVRNVSLTSLIFGFAFGITFGTFPAIIADQFGTEGFSTIWGLSTTGGILSVKVFSAIFANDLSRNTNPEKTICDKGSVCYAHTFQLIAKFAVGVAILNLVLVGITYARRIHKIRQLKHDGVFILDEDDESPEE
ncbi:LANO_0G09670g1_1 [Lachancea nothofagi CBS 11611]|uniref:LANO_0G09670g1_1 n=1 Tax=Lachancea nothofagi CBS 11611 TaxID=1266666 RepID=A0A1G4KIG3_9SACH|nr:LANO_0G09670g1_1 [Lachancea nothofagi CBS 11611]